MSSKKKSLLCIAGVVICYLAVSFISYGVKHDCPNTAGQFVFCFQED